MIIYKRHLYIFLKISIKHLINLLSLNYLLKIKLVIKLNPYDLIEKENILIKKFKIIYKITAFNIK